MPDGAGSADGSGSAVAAHLHTRKSFSIFISARKILKTNKMLVVFFFFFLFTDCEMKYDGVAQKCSCGELALQKKYTNIT